MAEALSGNLLVAQSGGPTAVINASLAGIISEALNHEDCIEEIYGGLNGILGILNEELVDLAAESQQVIRGLRHTPGAALGTCRYKMTQKKDFDRVIQVFQAHNIRYFFYIGGNDSQDTTHKIAQAAKAQNYDLRVLGIPKTIDNDLAMTDHCPGYGSAVKYLASCIRTLAKDHESMGQHDLVSVVEVMGRTAGWIAAGAIAARRRNYPEDAPHIICIPEVPFVKEQFLEKVKTVLQKNKFCLVVVSEGLVDADGNYVGASSSKDAFGHAHLSGAGDYVSQLISQELNFKARSAKLGTLQRSASYLASKTDNDEAFNCGKTAVKLAAEGLSDRMITLVRKDVDGYACEISSADLAEVANHVKPFPAHWITEDGNIHHQFLKYVLPLIQGEVDLPFEQGLPKLVELEGYKVAKKLGLDTLKEE